MDNTNTIDNIYFILSGLIAFSIYILIIVMVFFIFSGSKSILMSINTPSAINALDVNLIDDIEIPKQNENLSKNNEEKKDDSEGSSTPITGLGAADLFKSIETKEVKEIKKSDISDSRDKIAINKKNINNSESKKNKINDILDKANSVVSAIDNINKNMVVMDSNISDFCKKNHDYCEKIQNILYTNWNIKNTFTEKLSAIVYIKISKNGIFSYTINRYSGNTDFDKDLVDSLDKLKNITFPIINNEKLNINITFTNKKGL